MEKESLIRSRAHRILKRLKNYHGLLEDEGPGENLLSHISLQPIEKVIGYYDNASTKVNDSIVVTDCGLHIFRDENWKFVDYHEIARVDIPVSEFKRSADAIILHLRADAPSEIPVHGGDAKFRDAWQLFHFLARVIHDVQNL